VPSKEHKKHDSGHSCFKHTNEYAEGKKKVGIRLEMAVGELGEKP